MEFLFTKARRPLRLVLWLLAGATLVLLLVCPSRAAPMVGWEGRVVGVVDGDTLDVLQDGRSVRIRLEGVDCPERAQPWSRRATTLVSDLAFGRTASVRVVTVDRYCRQVARVEVEGRDLSRELLRSGLAWHFKLYNQDSDLADLETQARAQRRGLWSQADPIPPWEWRRGKRP
jgi:endonuclease YncB( thermonuclease family)